MNRIFVAALKEETPGLNFFYYTGAGKINATYNLTKLIMKHKPSEVINFGTAGAITKNLNPGFPLLMQLQIFYSYK